MTPHRNHSAGKVAIVTGGARGIGYAVAQSLRDTGAHVVIADVDADAAAEAARSLHVDHRTLDVTDQSSFEALVLDVHNAMGPVEILINNAGIMPIGPFLTMPPETARKAVEINTLGVLNGCRVVGQHMRHGRGGHIVNVASVAGRIAVPGMAAYNATKFAVVGFSEALSAELSPYGVEVSCVLPTFTKTALISGIRTGRAVKSIEPVDVAEAVQRALAGKRFTSAPANIGPALTMWPVLPRRLRAALLRYTGLDEAFLHPDSSARAGYDRRIASDPSDRHPHGERETTS